MPIVFVIDLCSSGALKAGTKVSTHTTVSSVQMLAVQLQFGVRSEVKMLPSFLRCFPSVETLVVVVTPLILPFHWPSDQHHYIAYGCCFFIQYYV